MREIQQTLAAQHPVRISAKAASRSNSIAVSSSSAPSACSSRRESRSSRRSPKRTSGGVVRRLPAAAAIGAHAPQHRVDACAQLAQVERLRHVVVGAEFQSDHPIDDVVGRGQHQDRHVVRARIRRAIAKPSSPGMLTSRISRSASPSARQASSSPPSARADGEAMRPRYSATMVRSPARHRRQSIEQIGHRPVPIITAKVILKIYAVHLFNTSHRGGPLRRRCFVGSSFSLARSHSQARSRPRAAISSASRLRAWKTRVFTVFCGTSMMRATSSIDCS